MFYRSEILAKELYKPGEVGKLLSLSNHSIIKYCNRGIITCVRNHNNHRRITAEEVCRYLDKQGLLIGDTDTGKSDVIYARVSTHKQAKRGDLDRQVQTLIDQNADLQNLLVLSEVGSRLNDKRSKLQQLLNMVMADEVNRIFITYRDRLTRFGFHYLETICLAKGVDIVVAKENKTLSTEEELITDMMSLIASFSGKLYSMRSHKKKCEDLKDVKLPNELTLEDIME